MNKLTVLFVISLLSSLAFGQKSKFTVVHDKPVITLEARVGKYWNIEQPNDSLPAAEFEHLKAISQGIRYDFSALYHLGEYFEIGLTYSGLKTTNTVKDVNISVVRPQGDTLNLYGNLVEGVKQNFFGPRLDARIKLGDFLFLRPGTSVGYLRYVNATDAAGYKYELKGGTLAVDIHASLQYKADDNWGIMVAASVMPTFIYEPSVEYENGATIVFTGGLLNVGHFHVGAGISYTFTKKNKDAMPAYF